MEKISTKTKQTITQFLIADSTGSMLLNIFDDRKFSFLFIFYRKKFIYFYLTILIFFFFSSHVFKLVGNQIGIGDVIYINGAYSSMYKDKMILYNGKHKYINI